MDAYDPWEELNRNPQLTLIRTELRPGLIGYYHHPLGLIFLDSRSNPRQQKCVLAHELQHFKFSDMPTKHRWFGLRQERRASELAAFLLVPADKLKRVLKIYPDDINKVADELDVTLDILETRLAMLKRKRMA